MSEHKCQNNSTFFASYINTPSPSDLPIPKFMDGKLVIISKPTKGEVEISPSETKENPRRNPRRNRNSRRRRKNVKRGEI